MKGKLILFFIALCVSNTGNVFAREAEESFIMNLFEDGSRIIVSGGVLAWVTGGDLGVPIGFGLGSSLGISISIERNLEKLSDDVNEYRATGEIGPNLEQFVFEVQKRNPDLSVEEILDSI